MEKTQILIMAGGIGSRLWPVSTPDMPKQFMDILGVGRSLIQLTVDRFSKICPVENFWVITSEKYAQTVRQQIPGIPEDQILAEPEGRNTAPCIAYACRKIAAKCPGANVAVTPSDALVVDVEKFVEAIKVALDFTRESSAIVTLGITPTRPEIGYGYIHAPNATEMTVCKVSAFKEKPDLQTARRYLSEGGYFWNAGIFVWNVGTINSSLRRFVPGIASVMDELEPSFFTSNEQEELRRLFPLCEKISIDYAVMEKSPDIFVVPCSPQWSDLGSWTSVREHLPQDENGNATVGKDVRLFDCHDCVIHAGRAKTIIAQGLDGYVIAENDGDILVRPLGSNVSK